MDSEMAVSGFFYGEKLVTIFFHKKGVDSQVSDCSLEGTLQM